MTDFFQPLKREDLQEKIDLCFEKGFEDLQSIKISLLQEKHDFERSIIRQQIQVQNLKEQIEYVDFLMAEEKKNG